MIDSHCHLDREPIYSSLDKVLLRSKNVGIVKLLTICTSDENFKVVLDLVDKDSMIFGTYGIHPVSYTHLRAHETKENMV